LGANENPEVATEGAAAEVAEEAPNPKAGLAPESAGFAANENPEDVSAGLLALNENPEVAGAAGAPKEVWAVDPCTEPNVGAGVGVAKPNVGPDAAGLGVARALTDRTELLGFCCCCGCWPPNGVEEPNMVFFLSKTL